MAVDFWAENFGALKRRIEAAIVEDMLLTQRSDDIMRAAGVPPIREVTIPPLSEE